MRALRSLLIALAATCLGCFGSSSSPVAPDASLESADDAGIDGASADALDAASGDATLGTGAPEGGGEGGDGGHASADGGVICVPSTCSSVKVVFVGWIAGADGGPESVELAVDDGTPDGGANGTVLRTATPADGGNANQLVGDFITTDDAGTLASPLAYANDNNYCNVPDFAGRTNEYLLASMQGLPVDPTWLAPQCGCGGSCGAACPLDGGPVGACDYDSEFYSQSCPNFGGNCVITPRRIEAIDIVPTTGDPTCKVCLYRSGAPSAATIVHCVSPGTEVSGADLAALSGYAADAGAGALLRLDDGTSCAAY